MNLIHRIELWGEQHHPRWMDVVRVILGIFLIIKGVQFLANISYLAATVHEEVPFPKLLQGALAYYVFAAHMAGGILLALGAYTRFAALLQIPILIGAIIFVHADGSIWKPMPQLLVAIVVLVLLLYFLVAGNGPWSLMGDNNEKGADR